MRLSELARAAFYHGVAAPLLFVACKPWFGFRVERSADEGRPSGGCVVVANHVHYLDAVLVALSAWPRRVRVLVARENWTHPLIGPFMRAFGCIPTGGTLAQTRDMLRRVRAVPASGHVLLVFPEGELACYREGLAPFKPGAFAVAASADAPVVPVALVQRRDADGRPRGAGLCRLFGRACLDVRWGEAVRPEPGAFGRARARDLERRARAEMERLLAR